QIILGKVRPFLRRLAEAHPQVLIIALTMPRISSEAGSRGAPWACIFFVRRHFGESLAQIMCCTSYWPLPLIGLTPCGRVRARRAAPQLRN
ncbi:hypothetical protein, partial [Mycobacterium sp. SMC-17]|uniref:hypothetical protein n=1 Tax=Mycobacterium sp. SMC-17 TaxID=3381628 RepID=UPI003875E323